MSGQPCDISDGLAALSAERWLASALRDTTLAAEAIVRANLAIEEAVAALSRPAPAPETELDVETAVAQALVEAGSTMAGRRTVFLDALRARGYIVARPLRGAAPAMTTDDLAALRAALADELEFRLGGLITGDSAEWQRMAREILASEPIRAALAALATPSPERPERMPGQRGPLAY